jgi:hypothetical protein
MDVPKSKSVISSSVINYIDRKKAWTRLWWYSAINHGVSVDGADIRASVRGLLRGVADLCNGSTCHRAAPMSPRAGTRPSATPTPEIIPHSKTTLISKAGEILQNKSRRKQVRELMKSKTHFWIKRFYRAIIKWNSISSSNHRRAILKINFLFIVL